MKFLHRKLTSEIDSERSDKSPDSSSNRKKAPFWKKVVVISASCAAFSWFGCSGLGRTLDEPLVDAGPNDAITDAHQPDVRDSTPDTDQDINDAHDVHQPEDTLDASEATDAEETIPSCFPFSVDEEITCDHEPNFGRIFVDEIFIFGNIGIRLDRCETSDTGLVSATILDSDCNEIATITDIPLKRPIHLSHPILGTDIRLLFGNIEESEDGRSVEVTVWPANCFGPSLPEDLQISTECLGRIHIVTVPMREGSIFVHPDFTLHIPEITEAVIAPEGEGDICETALEEVAVEIESRDGEYTGTNHLGEGEWTTVRPLCEVVVGIGEMQIEVMPAVCPSERLCICGIGDERANITLAFRGP